MGVRAGEGEAVVQLAPLGVDEGQRDAVAMTPIPPALATAEASPDSETPTPIPPCGIEWLAVMPIWGLRKGSGGTSPKYWSGSGRSEGGV